jgi:hypothetical protein
VRAAEARAMRAAEARAAAAAEDAAAAWDAWIRAEARAVVPE